MHTSITASPRFILSISFVVLFFAFAFPLLASAYTGISDIYISPDSARPYYQLQSDCPAGYTLKGGWANCASATCYGNKLECVKTSQNPTSCISDIYISSDSARIYSPTQNDCPAGYTLKGNWANCASATCYGNKIECVKVDQNPTSCISDIYISPDSARPYDQLQSDCPAGYTLKGGWANCASATCYGNKILCVKTEAVPHAPSPSSPPVCNATTNPTTHTTGASGSQTFSTVGTGTFTVPQYDGTLKIEVWGGGGGASGSPYFHNIAPGGAGGMSCANCSRSTSASSNERGGSQTTYTGGLIANGGLGGINASRQGPWWVIYVPASGGAGGTASGGTINTTGGAGGAGFGGTSPFGGAGGNASSIAGKTPGGGGGATSGEIGGGGAGGYSSVTYTPSQLTKGTSIPVIVGAGGVPGDANVTSNGSGAPGAVKFTWTATGQTLSLCSAGYTLKNGKCVSTAVCSTCPAGQTLKTIPGARIAATSGGGGTPGSQTYSTPGTHTFTVPANYQSLTVTVNGAGGGGSGAVGNNGQAGGKSSFKNTMIGNGGEGGVWDGGGAPKAANGSASGGNISNVTGGGAAGGVSARGTTYGVGGSGGQAKSTYAPGDLPASVTVVVGAGGAPEPTAVSLGGGGKAGSNGSVIITWTGGSSLSCPTGYTLQGSECVAPDTTQCVPDTTCPAGYHFDLLTNQCVINTPTICIPGYHLDTATNQCVPDGVTLVAAPTAWGFASLIHWDATGANSCTGTGFNTNGATSGTVTTDPLLQTTTFTLICDTGTKTVTVVIDSCPAGYTGTPPVCTLASNTCPAGYTGTPPNCSVASSCPLNYTGTPPNCTPLACVPTNICNGNNVVNSCTGALIQSCAYACASGACVVPPPSVVSWKVAPLVVNQGHTTNVSWEVRHVSSCTVSGTNGDSWTGLTGTKVSGPINAQTIFTLHCTALPGSGAPNVTRTATVNIVPVFQEK